MCLQPERQNSGFLFHFGSQTETGLRGSAVCHQPGDDALRHPVSLQHATACQALSIVSLLPLPLLSFFLSFFLFLSGNYSVFVFQLCGENNESVSKKTLRLVCSLNLAILVLCFILCVCSFAASPMQRWMGPGWRGGVQLL